MWTLNFQEEKGIGEVLYVLNGLTDIKDGRDKKRIERNIIEQHSDMIISHTACC